MGWLSPQVIAYLPLYQESPTPGPWYRLLGTGPRSRRWGVGQQWSFIRCSPSLPITPHHLCYHLDHPLPSLWKTCLPRNQSLMPRTLGTAALYYRIPPVVSTNVFGNSAYNINWYKVNSKTMKLLQARQLWCWESV